ncbi:hypothetical protein PIB30_067548 [Stylosanthes scabra]|uniref:Uncharacterized protein n=1 Tax=Stylosanthes scabra TaxID=79078 RepID=A0ABU6TN77_9FABA|nr:hypothetical protein [Stylosanthes scabra]
MEVYTMDAILAQNKAIAQQLTNLNKKIEKLEVASMGTQGETSSICGLCGGPYENHNCCLIREDQPLEQANYMGNQQRQPYQDPNTNTYNPRWRNHPNLGWGWNQNQRGSNFQNRPPYLFKDHHFLNQQPYHHHLNRNPLKLIPLKRLWKSSL